MTVYLRTFMDHCGYGTEYAGYEHNLTGEFEHRDEYDSDNDGFSFAIYYTFDIPESGYNVYVIWNEYDEGYDKFYGNHCSQPDQIKRKIADLFFHGTGIDDSGYESDDAYYVLIVCVESDGDILVNFLIES